MSDTPQVLLECARFRVERLMRTASDGSRHERQVVRHPGAVVIIPLLPENRVCLIDNFRPAIGKALIELPAGTREPGEPPELTAARELTEETGYVAGRLEHLQDLYPSPGIMDECMKLYIATELVPGPAAREPTEEIENREVTWESAIELIEAGQIQDAKTIAALLLWNLRS